jgi:hypothetical protein
MGILNVSTFLLEIFFSGADLQTFYDNLQKMTWEDNFSRRGCLNGWFSHFSRFTIRTLAFYGMVSRSCEK